MWPKLQLLAATATVIGICLLATAKVTHATNSASTTTVPQPLQPPTTPQNATTPTSNAANANAKEDNANKEDNVDDDDVDGLIDSAKELNKLVVSDLELREDLAFDSEVPEAEEQKELEETTQQLQQFVGVPGFLPTALPKQEEESSTTYLPTNGHGYIQFDINEQLPGETVRVQQDVKPKTKKDTVNEVLFSLFPNGFSDIFRFSGSEPNTEPATEAPTTPATTTYKAVVHATSTVEPSSSTKSPQSTQSTTLPPKNETYYSYQTTVTKEYRRELRPGHTQIVVEKVSSAERDPFRDGTNHISRDELLRINRAAVASPVLPSLLLRPDFETEDNETLVAAESAPIVILGEQETDFEDGQSLEDNQIAESRHMGQQLYQSRLPPPPESQSSSHAIESYNSQQGPAQDQQINVHIVHDESLNKAHEASKSQSQPQSQPQQALDHYQAHSEQRFQQLQQTQEAPSRQFLKSFKPTVSGSADGPIPKGSFHYESNNPPQRSNSKPIKDVDYTVSYVRPAAQLDYQRELSQPQPQPQPQPENSQSKLNTKAIASPDATPAPIDYAGFGGPTPNSLVYVTVNAHNPTPAPPAPQKPEEQLQLHLPSPHEYVSEAAAEPSQHHAQHAPAPQSDQNAHSQPETQLLVKPNGYTFVEVQKSINIHNKLITEKDGQLVEMHETIYPPSPYLQNHFSSEYSPKHYVSAAAPEATAEPSHPPPAPAKNYVSLATNPINVEQVEYDSSPQEGAISHATLNLETGHHASAPNSIHSHHVESHAPPVTHVEEHVVQSHAVPVEKIVERPVHQFVEKHIPIPYAVPQPVAVPVHIEHYVDRPYPVEHYVEQPVPYPVETIVEKIVEKHVPVEVERFVDRPVEVEKIVEKFIDRPMAIPIHVPVAIHMPMPPHHSHGFNFGSHPNALSPWQHASIAHIPPKVLQNYYTRMLKKLLPQLTAPKTATKTLKPGKTAAKATLVKPPTKPVRGEAPLVATFSLADMRFDLRPPPPPQGSPWLQGARYIYNTLPSDLSTSAASAPAHMVKSYIGPVPTTSTSNDSNGSEFDEFQRWRNGHNLKRSPEFGRNLHMEYGFKPPLVPSVEIDDKGMPLKQADAEVK